MGKVWNRTNLNFSKVFPNKNLADVDKNLSSKKLLTDINFIRELTGALQDGNVCVGRGRVRTV